MSTQKKIAEAVGCTQGAVSRWLQGEVKPHTMFAKLLQQKFPKEYQRMVAAYEKKRPTN